MLTLLRVPRLNKNSKNSNGQELEKTLEESKEMDIKRKENKLSGMDLQFWIFQGVLHKASCAFMASVSANFIMSDFLPIILLGDLKIHSPFYMSFYLALELVFGIFF